MSAATVRQVTVDVATYPYMVTKTNRPEPRYFKKFKDAQASMRKDIEWFKDTWTGLNLQDSIAACVEALHQIDALSEFDGGEINAVVDPYTDLRYRASLVRRQQA